MATKRASSFRGKVSKDAQKSMRVSRGYLNLPDGIKQYNVKEGTKRVMFDILPYVVSDPKHPNRDDAEGIALVGDLWYKRPFKLHRNVGADNDSCVCPKSVGKPCPICEYQKKQFEKGADKEETIELYPKDRNLYIIIPRDKNATEDIMVWDMSQKLFQDTLKDTLDEDPENEIFPDLEEGLTLEVEFKWKKFGKSTFPEATHIEFFKRDPYEEKILDEVPDLDKVLKVLSYEELSNKFFEIEGEDHETLTDVDEAPVPERRRRSEPEPAPERTRRSAPVETKDEPETPTWEELGRLSFRNLKRMAVSRDLGLPIDDYIDDEDGLMALKEDIAKELNIEMPKPKPVKREEPTRSRRSEPAPEPKEEPTKTVRRERPAPKEEGDNKCPFGHKFGADCEKFDDCDTCDVWNDCIVAKGKK